MGRHAVATAAHETSPSWWRATHYEMTRIMLAVSSAGHTGQFIVQYDVTGWFWFHSHDPAFASIINEIL